MTFTSCWAVYLKLFQSNYFLWLYFLAWALWAHFVRSNFDFGIRHHGQDKDHLPSLSLTMVSETFNWTWFFAFVFFAWLVWASLFISKAFNQALDVRRLPLLNKIKLGPDFKNLVITLLNKKLSLLSNCLNRLSNDMVFSVLPLHTSKEEHPPAETPSKPSPDVPPMKGTHITDFLKLLRVLLQTWDKEFASNGLTATPNASWTFSPVSALFASCCIWYLSNLNTETSRGVNTWHIWDGISSKTIPFSESILCVQYYTCNE